MPEEVELIMSDNYVLGFRCWKCGAFKKHNSPNPSLCLRCNKNTETIDEASEAYQDELRFQNPVEYL